MPIAFAIGDLSDSTDSRGKRRVCGELWQT
jgi:hypothetical protein